MLSQDERNDLRLRVLRGEQLTLDQAREVYLTLRQGQGASVATADKPKRQSKRKVMSDEELNASLDAALGS